MTRKYAIGIILVLLLLVVGSFYLASSYKKTSQQAAITTITPTPTPSEPSIDTAQPEVVAANFYSAYQNCMRLPSSPNSIQTLSQFCQTNNRLTLESFNKQVATQTPNPTGMDPVFCAKEPPTDLANDLKLGTITYSSNTASVPIIEMYGKKIVTIQIALQKNELNQWKVEKIVCQ